MQIKTQIVGICAGEQRFRNAHLGRRGLDARGHLKLPLAAHGVASAGCNRRSDEAADAAKRFVETLVQIVVAFLGQRPIPASSPQPRPEHL